MSSVYLFLKYIENYKDIHKRILLRRITNESIIIMEMKVTFFYILSKDKVDLV